MIVGPLLLIVALLPVLVQSLGIVAGTARVIDVQQDCPAEWREPMVDAALDVALLARQPGRLHTLTQDLSWRQPVDPAAFADGHREATVGVVQELRGALTRFSAVLQCQPLPLGGEERAEALRVVERGHWVVQSYVRAQAGDEHPRVSPALGEQVSVDALAFAAVLMKAAESEYRAFEFMRRGMAEVVQVVSGDCDVVGCLAAEWLNSLDADKIESLLVLSVAYDSVATLLEELPTIAFRDEKF